MTKINRVGLAVPAAVANGSHWKQAQKGNAKQNGKEEFLNKLFLQKAIQGGLNADGFTWFIGRIIAQNRAAGHSHTHSLLGPDSFVSKRDLSALADCCPRLITPNATEESDQVPGAYDSDGKDEVPMQNKHWVTEYSLKGGSELPDTLKGLSQSLFGKIEKDKNGRVNWEKLKSAFGLN